MSKYHSYLNSATLLLTVYNGEEPFASFTRKYFAANKKFGSKDRKWVSHLCYCFFRLGKTGRNLPVDERILAGLYICSASSNELLAELRPEWNSNVAAGFEEKISSVNRHFDAESIRISDVFPRVALSAGVNEEALALSHFIQPDLFIRLRPGKENKVKDKLQAAGLDFREVMPDCLALANSVQLENVIGIDAEAVVQDYSSQRVGALIPKLEAGNKVWDCCAASGGKSILAFDKLGEIELTVSDIRQSVLVNLRKRFERAGLRNYHLQQMDLASSQRVPSSVYELVIADLPCTGSGTWSRTPEQLYYFKEEKIEEYAALQKRISSNVIQALKPGGWLLYITCSVFQKENEENIEFLQREFGMLVRESVLFKGYNDKADTLFASLVQKAKA